MHGGTPKSSILFSDGLWFSLINQPLRTGYPHKLPICSMVLEYLPTKLGNFWGKCWCSYSSTMVRIWVRKPPNESLVSIGKSWKIHCSLENHWKIHWNDGKSMVLQMMFHPSEEALTAWLKNATPETKKALMTWGQAQRNGGDWRGSLKLLVGRTL